MITETQYLRALKTIDLYHRQKTNPYFTEEVQIVKQKTDLHDVKVGDFIVYKRIVGRNLKDFVLGKKYQVIDEKQGRNKYNPAKIKLVNEFGSEIWIPRKNHYRRWETL